jgi:hypothetical protein
MEDGVPGAAKNTGDDACLDTYFWRDTRDTSASPVLARLDRLGHCPIGHWPKRAGR